MVKADGLRRILNDKLFLELKRGNTPEIATAKKILGKDISRFKKVILYVSGLSVA